MVVDEIASEHVPNKGMRDLAQSVPTTGQAKKSARGMPWHQEPMKDVTSCEKLRGAAHELRTGDVRMGKPGGAILRHHMVNQIVI